MNPTCGGNTCSKENSIMKKPNPKIPGITSGVQTAEHGKFWQFTGPTGFLWFSEEDLIERERDLRVRIGKSTGHPLVTNAEITKFKEAVQNWKRFSEGQVAPFAGWAGQDFVCGDGSVCTPSAYASAVVGSSFIPHPKFAPRGSLTEWQALVTPFVRDQPLPYFAVAFALTGPLLQLMPPHIVNPHIELVGEGKSGKTTLGVLAASVWAGDVGSSVGGGETLDMTPGYIDRHRQAHRDMFLLLDEAENQRNAEQRKELMATLAFKVASTQGKKRLTDTSASPSLRIALMITTNTSLRAILSRDPESSREAALSRVLSLNVARSGKSGSVSIFDSIPSGFSSMSKAVQSLRSISRRQVYGTAGPGFARWLVDQRQKDESGLCRRIADLVSQASDRLDRQGDVSDERHRDMLALIEAAAVLAQEAAVMPTSWGSPAEVMDYISGAIGRSEPDRSADFEEEWQRFLAYVRAQAKKRNFLPIETPFIGKPQLVQRVPGFVRKSDATTEVFIDPDHFKKTFSMSHAFLKKARSQGRMLVPPSESDRLAVHPPKRLANYGFGRVYGFRL